MAYTPFYEDGWENAPSEDTPISAEALTHVEQGIADAHDELNGKADSSDIPDTSGLVSQSAHDALVDRVEALESANGDD